MSMNPNLGNIDIDHAHDHDSDEKLGPVSPTTNSVTGKDSEAATLHELADDTEKDLDATELSAYPDGGLRAWLVILGTFCATFSTFGVVNAWGVFQSYYETHLLKDTSSSDIAWIGSIQYSLTLLPAVVVGRLFDVGYLRLPFALGSATIIVSTFVIPQCTKYWELVLIQGLLVGLGCGICFGPVVGVIGHWFNKRRGFVLAVNASATSVGGTVIPIMAKQLIPRVGFPWTLRIIGFMLVLTLGVANIALKRRIPPKKVAGGIFNFAALKSAPFAFYCCSTLVAFLGMYTVLTFIAVSATTIGLSEDFSFYLVSIANAGSGFGRLTTAFIVDKTGPVNYSVPMTIVAALVTYLWPLAHTKSSIIAVTVLYGFTSAAYLTTLQMPAYALGDIEDVGRRAGMVMTFSAFGAIAGPPISGAIYQASGGFAAVGCYAGSAMLLSCLLIMTTRQLVLKRFIGKF